MAPRQPFSERHGYAPPDAEIKIRQDAPYDLRGVVVDLAYESGFSPSPLRALICRVLRTRADSGNWSEWPNIDGEVRQLVDSADWHEVYDIVEAIAESLVRRQTEGAGSREQRPEHFTVEINKYFRRNGIGWQLQDGEVRVRGPEAFEGAVRTAGETLKAGHQTAQQEIHEALHDLSRRPEPDLTGAVQHSMAALECVAREVTGDRNATFGDILKRHPKLFPRPLDQSLEKLWGYACEYGRHVREGMKPDLEEAELIVGLASVAATYAAKKTRGE